MKAIAAILLKFGVAIRVALFDKERNNDNWFYIDDASLLHVIDDRARALAINCGDGDVFALGLINPKPELLKQVFKDLGIPSDYKWFVRSEGRHLLYFRLTYLKNHFGKEDLLQLEPKDSQQVERVSIQLKRVTPFAPYSIEDLQYDFVNGAISETTPPHEVHVNALIKCLSDFTNINELLPKIAADNKEVESQEPTAEHIETSLLPYHLYDKVPKVIKNFIDLFYLPRERDIAFLGLLVIISSCIPNVISSHRRKKIWAYLYLVVTAGAASGKGVLSDVIRVVSKIEKFYRDKYEQELKEYKADRKRFKAGELDEEPTPPKRQTLQVPTDNSFIAFFKQLVDNGERGLMFETEIDVFVNAGKQEWGNYSTVNRKATHHEPHTTDRKYLEEPLHVEAPKIAMVMSGTPNQFFNLFPSIEDGLYSRYMVYSFQVKEIKLINPYINSSNELFERTIEDTTDMVFDMYQELANSEYEIQFEWTEKQADTLYNHFDKTLQASDPIYGEGTASVILRHMLVATRLGMVLTAMEYREKNKLMGSKIIYANDQTVDVVIGIIETSSQHSLLMMNNIKANAKAKPLEMKSMKMIQFFNALPEGRQFKTNEAIEIGKTLQISARSVGDYLPALCKSGHLERTATGQYRRKR